MVEAALPRSRVVRELIRDLRREDVGELAPLIAALVPEQPVWTPRGLLHWIDAEPARARLRNWVAEANGEIVGWATAALHWWTERGDVGWAWAGVREDGRGGGIGTRLFSLAEGHLLEAGARKLETFAHEGSVGERFAQARGYARARSERFSSLDPHAADLSRLPALERAKEAEGFRAVPLRAVRDRPHELHALYAECEADMPSDDAVTNLGYEEWLQETFESPDLDDDSSFVVLAGEERTVALCFLEVDRDARVAENEMTGTLRDFRLRGLARLAKLTTIRSAAEQGIHEIWTGNDAENRGMLALNDELGYRPRIVRVQLARAAS